MRIVPQILGLGFFPTLLTRPENTASWKKLYTPHLLLNKEWKPITDDSHSNYPPSKKRWYSTSSPPTF
jgi:hypothetical protein